MTLDVNKKIVLCNLICYSIHRFGIGYPLYLNLREKIIISGERRQVAG